MQHCLQPTGLVKSILKQHTSWGHLHHDTGQSCAWLRFVCMRIAAFTSTIWTRIRSLTSSSLQPDYPSAMLPGDKWHALKSTLPPALLQCSTKCSSHLPRMANCAHCVPHPAWAHHGNFCQCKLRLQSSIQQLLQRKGELSVFHTATDHVRALVCLLVFHRWLHL